MGVIPVGVPINTLQKKTRVAKRKTSNVPSTTCTRFQAKAIVNVLGVLIGQEETFISKCFYEQLFSYNDKAVGLVPLCFSAQGANRSGVAEGSVSPTPSHSARDRHRRASVPVQIQNRLDGAIWQRRPFIPFIPFHRYELFKSVTTAGRPAGSRHGIYQSVGSEDTDFSPIYRRRLTTAIAAAHNNYDGTYTNNLYEKLIQVTAGVDLSLLHIVQNDAE